MKKNYLLLFALLISLNLFAQSVFINELHYDNNGADSGEGVEIAGPAGTDLTGWKVELYNGSNSLVYKTISLSGIIDDEGTGYGALNFPKTAIQNGAPDGLALIDNNGTVIQFLSYEGTLTAGAGTTAAGITSTDIGVSESGGTAVGTSLQLSNGPGSVYTDFTWVADITATPGSLNNNQVFTLSIDQKEATNISIYPNPTNIGYVKVKTTSNAVINVTAFDILGKQVIAETLRNNRLDVSNLNTGVYVLQLNQNGATTTKKLVIK